MKITREELRELNGSGCVEIKIIKNNKEFWETIEVIE